MLLSMVQADVNAKKLVSHRFDLSKIMKAYDTFGNASKERALEVVLKEGEAQAEEP